VTNQTSASFLQRPSTRLGWWAVRLAGLFIVLFMINSLVLMPVFSTTSNASLAWFSQTFLPFYGILMALCGLAAGIVGLLAVIRQHERSWLVWLTILPGALVLFLVLGELVLPH
jgi:succinate dehydrogenase hydrophobic anchor subunit